MCQGETKLQDESGASVGTVNSYGRLSRKVGPAVEIEGRTEKRTKIIWMLKTKELPFKKVPTWPELSLTPALAPQE